MVVKFKTWPCYQNKKLGKKLRLQRLEELAQRKRPSVHLTTTSSKRANTGIQIEMPDYLKHFEIPKVCAEEKESLKDPRCDNFIKVDDQNKKGYAGDLRDIWCIRDDL